MSQPDMDDDAELTLSPHALDALKQFYVERDVHAGQFERLKAEAERNAGHDAVPEGTVGTATEQQPLSITAFTEDWNESQFWYSDETANLLAKQLLDGATSDTTIAVVSAPSVFVSLKNAVTSDEWKERPRPSLVLLEHDRRFAVFPEFVFYDFTHPIRLPAHLRGSIDRIICDPPFLSEDCQTKAALTVRWLSRTLPPTLGPTGQSGPASEATAAADSSRSPPPLLLSRLIVCTGERMQGLVTRLYRPLAVRTTDYEPRHARGLGNEFYCYANFECSEWKWRTGTEGR